MPHRGGPFEDDPDPSDRKYPGNPMRSYRTLDPLRVVEEVVDREPCPPKVLPRVRDHLAELKHQGVEAVDD